MEGEKIFKPAYLRLHKAGELEGRALQLKESLANCTLCPRSCHVNRLKGERGICRTASLAMVSSYNAHFGEERPLVGVNGSGTIFFTNCNLLCVFCQNYDISHEGMGHEVSPGQLAAIMVSLQKQGCHNINLVTPSHVVAQIVEALPLAIEKGLNIPLVYNSSGYDSLLALKLLDGIVDIYMPDFKFWYGASAKRYCKAYDYPEKAREALKEMARQVGELTLDERGLATRGLLVRHLVMPGGLDETREIMRFLANEISIKTYVNVMGQYRPCGKARNYHPLDRALRQDEYEEACRIAREAGLLRLDERDLIGMFRQLGII